MSAQVQLSNGYQVSLDCMDQTCHAINKLAQVCPKAVLELFHKCCLPHIKLDKDAMAAIRNSSLADFSENGSFFISEDVREVILCSVQTETMIGSRRYAEWINIVHPIHNWICNRVCVEKICNTAYRYQLSI
jgi:hypothetical protein